MNRFITSEIIQTIKIKDNVYLLLKEILSPTQRQLKFKKRNCSRCGRLFYPNIGTQPTCSSCFYIIKCNYCGEFYKPEPVRITKKEQTSGNHFCSKKHGDKFKAEYINKNKLQRFNGFKIKFCNKCFKNTMHNGNICYSCNPNKKNYFDREKFYNKKFELINFESEEKIISFEDIDNLMGIPGVWAIYSSDNKCLDVCSTINIGKEMLVWIRNYIACKNKSDEELEFMNKTRQKYNRKKKRDIGLYCDKVESKPIFKIVKTNVYNRLIREEIEMQYAFNTKSMFWSPAPGEQYKFVSYKSYI